jgi:very-short-patch-repair endonuclease
LQSRFSRQPQATARARKLRLGLTEAEKKLWAELRNGQLGGFTFRRQHPIGPFVADFYCSSLKLVIELDGGQHTCNPNKQRDKQRTTWLRSRDIDVMRFWNNDVLNNTDGVLHSIAMRLAALSRNDPHPTSPLPGEGKPQG